MNRELDADFDLDAFEHVAVFDTDHEWIEMRLRVDSTTQTVASRALDLDVPFAAGEEMRTEVEREVHAASGVERELADAGMQLARWWTDPDGDFALLAGPCGRSAGLSGVGGARGRRRS